MGIFGAIGKMAGSKIVEGVKDEFTMKQNREQTGGYCKYIKTNLTRVSKIIVELENETKALVEYIQAKKDIRLSFKEKGDFRKNREKAKKNLEYLYLTRDFFTTLAKNVSGLMLKNEELMLVVKFAPYFDGVPVLDFDDDESSDDSVLGTFKEVGQELKGAFISSKKAATHFDFDEYLYRYTEKIEKYIMPDIDSAIENFNNAMEAQEIPDVSDVDVIVDTPPKMTEEVECPNCHTELTANAKFCPECGSKIKAKKPAFCIECGESINLGSKYCSNCGMKLI